MVKDLLHAIVEDFPPIQHAFGCAGAPRRRVAGWHWTAPLPHASFCTPAFVAGGPCEVQQPTKKPALDAVAWLSCPGLLGGGGAQPGIAASANPSRHTITSLLARRYGSGVFHQPDLYDPVSVGPDGVVAHTGGRPDSPQLDFIFAVDDPRAWHAEVRR